MLFSQLLLTLGENQQLDLVHTMILKVVAQ